MTDPGFEPEITFTDSNILATVDQYETIIGCSFERLFFAEVDYEFVEYLIKMSGDYEKFMAFLNLLSSTEKSQWMTKHGSRGRGLADTFLDRQRDFNISDSDSLWQGFIDWFAYLFPRIAQTKMMR